MDLFDHYRTIWRHRWQVAVVAVLIAGAVYGWSLTRPPVYGAKALVSVTSGRAVAGETVTQDDTLFLTRNYAELAGTRPILADAARRSGLGISAADARSRVTAHSARDVGFITVAATGPSPESATALAQAAANALMAAVGDQQAAVLRQTLEPVEAEIAQVEGRLAQVPDGAGNRGALEARYDALVRAATDRRLAPTDRLVLVSPARGEPEPLSPVPMRNAVLALLVALVVASELAVLVEVVRDRFSHERDEDGATDLLGLPVLARVPVGSEAETIEAFRRLRTTLMFLDTTGPMRTVAVVSSNPNAGKTFTCLHLARSVTALEISAVLIDGDLRRPTLHGRLGVGRSPGLGDLLKGAPVPSALRPSPGDERLHVVPGGSPVDDPAGMLASRTFREILGQLDGAGLVVVDTPACDFFADGLAVASQCDATIVVIDAVGTRRRAVRRLVHHLRGMGANPIGIVINRAQSPSRGKYYYYRQEGRTAASRS